MKKLLALMMGFTAFPVMAAPYFEENFDQAEASKSFQDTTFTSYSLSSNKDWYIYITDNNPFASANGYSADEASDDWLISQAIDLGAASAPQLQIETAKKYDGGDFKVKVSSNYSGSGSPEGASWTEVTPTKLSTGEYNWVTSEPIDLSAYSGQTIYLAFHYTSTGPASGQASLWQVDNVVIEEESLKVDASADAASLFVGQPLNLTVDVTNNASQNLAYFLSINGAAAYAWTPGEAISLTQAGKNTIKVTVDDGQTSSSDEVEVYLIESTHKAILDKPEDAIRIATYNINLIGESETVADLPGLLADGNYQKAQLIAELIQRVRPDIILLNEFDYDEDGLSLQRFRQNYLQIAQQSSLQPINYDYAYINEVNTGLPSGMDLNKNGVTGEADDAFGFGQYPGKYGMAVLSVYPIKSEDVRTFQKFLWKDMPNAMLPKKTNGDDWYTEDDMEAFRLSSKSHWDLPLEIDGETLHVLASHPTPPTFDGEEDRNGTRNHDEIRFWADYIDASKSTYVYDDQGVTGGLPEGSRFVIMGDQNASPDEGDATGNPIQQLLENSLVDSGMVPASLGAVEKTPGSEFAPNHTANWQMRADYVLPSEEGFDVVQSAVFWPTTDHELSRLAVANTPTDHRMVYVDLKVSDTQTPDDQVPDDQTPDDQTPAEEAASSSGGGCTLVSGRSSGIDPVLVLMLLLSTLYLLSSKKRKD